MRTRRIHIDNDLDDELRQMAALEGRPAAALIRDAIRAYLHASNRTLEDDPFRPFIGAYGGPGAAAEHHDRSLYGRDLDEERRE